LVSAAVVGCGGSSSGTTGTPSTPDFSLGVSPSSLTITQGAAGSAVTVTASPSDGFTGSVSLSVSSLASGVTASPASATLSPGTAQTVTFAASAQAATGAKTVTLTGTSGSLTHTATVSLTVAAAASSTPAVDVTTYHNDNARDGLNAQETTLNPTNVNSKTFGLVATYPVDGNVDAEPLYLSNVALGGSTANVLYVATEGDSVYAFNASSNAQIWKTSIIGSGETTSDARGCNQISPQIGITSTPVIDRNAGAHGAIFVVGMTKDSSGNYHQRIHALDLTTGAELSGSPTEITATYPGTGANSTNGKVSFDPGQYAERVGLLLLNGTIYTAWTSHCDIQPYTGWVMGYDETTLKQTTVLNLTPNGSEGAVWMSGYGLAADTSGNIFFIDANGTLDDDFSSSDLPDKMDYGNAMVKLSTANGLALADYFEPYDTDAESAADTDFGSGGAMLLPDQTDASGKTRHLVVGAGKDKNIYVADRDNMGKFNQSAGNNSNLYQELPNALARGAWSGPAYFNNTVYYAGVGDALKAFPISKALLATTPSSTSSVTFPYPGSTPGVSANGTQNGIVWAVESAQSSAAVLHAYDATNLANELYNSNQAGTRDAFGKGNKFITPMVVNGRVYVGTPNSVAAFGLLGQ
jgi:hypothetical protein